MKIQWTLSDGSTDWVAACASIGGMKPAVFCDRLIRYHAGGLSEQERQIFEHLLEVVDNKITVDFDDIEEEG